MLEEHYSMDPATIAVIGSVVLGLIAAIPTMAGLISQNRKDKKQQELDMNSAALTAATSIIAPSASRTSKSAG